MEYPPPSPLVRGNPQPPPPSPVLRAHVHFHSHFHFHFHFQPYLASWGSLQHPFYSSCCTPTAPPPHLCLSRSPHIPPTTAEILA